MQLDEALLKALAAHPEGLKRAELQRAVKRPTEPAWRILRVLERLEASGLVEAVGNTRARRYRVRSSPAESSIFSADGERLVAGVRRPLAQRTPCSYEGAFLDGYLPNRTFYLRDGDRARLRAVGVTPNAGQPAGTYARQILERLLIDLSWNSSRLEGNTYSLLDTERLFSALGAPEGRPLRETQMLLNHKQAIEYLVEGAGELDLTPRALRTLHGMLAENLLSDPAAEGRLRRSVVGIHDSPFIPLSVPQLIDERFEQLLTLARMIKDPFEQSFFLLVHLPYLQPFEDVNKRTARLAANLPLLKNNLQPLAFVDLPREAYTLATLAVYELRRIEALRDVYLWAYQRSAERYRAIVVSLGEPDAFRLRHRQALREAVRTIVEEAPPPKLLEKRIQAVVELGAAAADRSLFEEHLRQDLRNLNEGTFARYRLRPSEFERWRKVYPA